MADAKRDNNRVTTLLAVSNVDGLTPVVVYADPATHALLISGSISATNPSVGTNTATAPTSSTEIGWIDGSGNLQGVSAAQPLPVSGSISLTNPSTGAAVPATANYVAGNKAGNLTGLLIGSQNTSNSLAVALASDQVSIPVAATLTAETTKVIGVTRTADGAGNLLTSTTNALDVNIKSGISQYVDGAARGTATGNLGMVDDGTNIQSMHGDTSGNTYMLLTDGTNTANVVKADGTAAAQAALITAPSRLEVSFTTTIAQAVASTDVSNYRMVSVHTVTQGGSSTVAFQISNDNINWVSIALNGSTSVGSSSPTASTGGVGVVHTGPITARYFRLNVTGIISGTTAGVVEFFSEGAVAIGGMFVGGMGVSTSGPQKLEDVASVGGDAGIAVYGIRQDTPVANANVNASGDYLPLITDNFGKLWTASEGIKGATLPLNALTLGVSDGTNLQGVLQAANALNSTGTGLMTSQIVAQFDDASPTAITENQFGNLRMSANRNFYGTIRDAAGNERGVNVTAGNALVSDITSIAGTAIVTGGTAGSQSVGGIVANNGTINSAVNPILIAGQAVSSENTANTTAKLSQFVTDLVGKLIVLPYANPENFVSGAITSAMTGTTTTSLIAAPASGLRNYITQITVSNSHATVGTDVIIQDGSGGTTLYTIPAAAVYGGAAITFPTPLRQPTTATAIFCANVTTGASTKVSASGYKGI